MTCKDFPNKHRGNVVINSLESQLISSNITKQTTMPTITVDNPLNFSVNIDYKMEALPLKELIIKVNNINYKFNKSCNQFFNNKTDCMEVTNQQFNDLKVEFPNNNTYEIIFDYNLDIKVNCTDIKKLPPFRYEFKINWIENRSKFFF